MLIVSEVFILGGSFLCCQVTVTDVELSGIGISLTVRYSCCNIAV